MQLSKLAVCFKSARLKSQCVNQLERCAWGRKKRKCWFESKTAEKKEKERSGKEKLGRKEGELTSGGITAEIRHRLGSYDELMSDQILTCHSKPVGVINTNEHVIPPWCEVWSLMQETGVGGWER